jgi:hypothetical protein
MKIISEFKGYWTRVEFDAETKQFISQRAADPFPVARQREPEVAGEESPAIATDRKYAA